MKKIKNKGNQKGITMIALIIMIIVILILAGISIGVLQRSGLVDETRGAKQDSKEAQIKSWAMQIIYDVESTYPYYTSDEVMEEVLKEVTSKKDEVKEEFSEEKDDANSVQVDSALKGDSGKKYFNLKVDEDTYKISIDMK